MEKEITLSFKAVDGVSVPLASMTTKLSKVSQTVGALNRGPLSRLGKTFSGVWTGIKGTLSALSQTSFIAAAAASIGSYSLAVRQAGDDVSTLAKRYQMSSEALQVWGSLLSSSGGSAQNAANGMRALTASMQKAKAGDAELLYVFRQMGISLADLRNMSSQDVLGKMAEAFSNPKNTNELAKQAILVKTMGQDGTYFMDALNQGTNAYSDKLAEMKADGAIMSPDQLATAREFESRWNSISSILSGIKMDFGLEAAKALLPLMEKLRDFLRDPEQSRGLRESLRQIAQSLPAIGSAVMPIVQTIARMLSLFGSAVSWIHNVFGDVGVAVAAVGVIFAKALWPVLSLVGSIVSGFGGLSGIIGAIATNFVPVVSAIGMIVAKAGIALAIGSSVLSIVGLIGGAAYLLYQKCEPFRNLVDFVWEKIKGIANTFRNSRIGKLLGLGTDEGNQSEEKVEPDQTDKTVKPTISESAASLFASPSPAPAATTSYDPYAASKALNQRDAHAEARVKVEVTAAGGARAVIRDVRQEGRVDLDASQGLIMVGGD